MFELRHDYYAGPMAKLLQLVEERQLEISRVSIGAVTADFIAYVEQLGEQTTSDVLSDFIVVAARLLVLKSKELVPTLELTEEEELGIGDLEHRLQLYREFKRAGELLKKQWDGARPLYGRSFLSGSTPDGFFYPSEKVRPDILREALAGLLRIMEGLSPETRTVAATTMVTLQQKMSEIVQRLKQQAVTFKGRASTSQRQEVIVLFLAVLHLLANRLANVEQEDQFGDITVSSAVENS
jgi:segregation and condensation protein A